MNTHCVRFGNCCHLYQHWFGSDELSTVTDARGRFPSGDFGVASSFYSRQSKVIKNVCEKILALVAVHGGAPFLSDFNSFFDPSFVFVLLRAYDLRLVPTNHMVIRTLYDRKVRIVTEEGDRIEEGYP